MKLLTTLIIFFTVSYSIYILLMRPKLRYQKVSDFFIGIVLAILLTLEIPMILYIFSLMMPKWEIGSLFFIYLFYFYASIGILQIFYIMPVAIMFAQKRHWQKMAGIITGAVLISLVILSSVLFYPLNI
jgi:hypothetical protein